MHFFGSCFVFVVFCVCLVLFVCPQYKVFQKLLYRWFTLIFFDETSFLLSIKSSPVVLEIRCLKAVSQWPQDWPPEKMMQVWPIFYGTDSFSLKFALKMWCETTFVINLITWCFCIIIFCCPRNQDVRYLVVSGLGTSDHIGQWPLWTKPLDSTFDIWHIKCY